MSNTHLDEILPAGHRALSTQQVHIIFTPWDRSQPYLQVGTNE